MTATMQLPTSGGPTLMHEQLASGSVVLCGASDPTQDNRPTEDRAAAWSLPNTTVLTVADGVGGHATGGHAADLAIETLGASVELDDDTELRHAVLDAFERANRRVCELGTGAATTLATAIIIDRKLRALHVGDSVIMVVGGRGAIRMQTVAHSPVGYALESGLLSEGEALHHEDRHVVSNVLGQSDMRVEMHAPIALKPRDTVVLATDGVLDNLDVAEVAELVRKGPLEAAAENLAKACRKRMLEPENGHPSKPDDATFVLFRPRSLLESSVR